MKKAKTTKVKRDPKAEKKAQQYWGKNKIRKLEPHNFEEQRQPKLSSMKQEQKWYRNFCTERQGTPT